MNSAAQANRAMGHHRSCPQCGSQQVSRRHRRTGVQYLRSLAGIYPYKCESCDHRFDSRRSPRAPRQPHPETRRARCPNCHSIHLDRIARSKVPPSWGNLLWRLVRARAYRCPRCRKRFFTLRAQEARSGTSRREHSEPK